MDLYLNEQKVIRIIAPEKIKSLVISDRGTFSRCKSIWFTFLALINQGTIFTISSSIETRNGEKKTLSVRLYIPKNHLIKAVDILNQQDSTLQKAANLGYKLLLINTKKESGKGEWLTISAGSKEANTLDDVGIFLLGSEYQKEKS